jgi:hypothetical protein
MLAEVLRRAGWRTAGTFSGPYLEGLWGFDRGFERYRAGYSRIVEHLSRKVTVLNDAITAALARGDRQRADVLKWKRREVYLRVRERSHVDVTSEAVTREAIADVEEFARGTAPWFVFVHYFDPHYDYVPPPPWDTRFDPAYRGAVNGHGFITNAAIAVPDPADPDRRERRAIATSRTCAPCTPASSPGWTTTWAGSSRDWTRSAPPTGRW